MNKNGSFVISLDFELHWGAAEKWDLANKSDYFDVTRKSIPKVLSLFEKFEVHATWATVGFLFGKNREQLLNVMPKNRPAYTNKILSYYSLFDNNEVGNNELTDPYHFAPSLIKLIIDTPNQEIATHTFAHYYCMEDGQTTDQFDEDLKAVQKIAKNNFGISMKSLVFPRNQFNVNYLDVAYKNGIKVVRSNPDVWFWKTKSGRGSAIARGFDTLMPISTSLTFPKEECLMKENVLLLPASRFLRPFAIKEKRIQKLKFNRIKSEMTKAAKKHEVYHLWWHPHNFGECLKENLEYLEQILELYKDLNKKYNFASRTMLEVHNDINSVLDEN